MRQFELREWTEMRTTAGNVLPDQILENGTIISLVLDGKQLIEPNSVRADGSEIMISNILSVLPKCNVRTEELFFKIIQYIPAPKDRYLLERIDFPAGIVLTDGANGKDQLLRIRVDECLREILISQAFPDKWKLIWKQSELKIALSNNRISIQKYEERMKEMREEYHTLKEAANIRGMAPVDSEVELKCKCFHVTKESDPSLYLKIGDRITAKRKNIKFVQMEEHVNSTRISRICVPEYVTTWGGELLDPAIRNHVGVGNIVRVIFDFTNATSCIYVRVIAKKNGYLLGIAQDTYLTDHDEWIIGLHVAIKPENISEIPDWPGNENLSALFEKYKGRKCLRMTGTTALGNE